MVLSLSNDRPLLFLGRRGELVKAAQKLLNLHRYYLGGKKLDIDGYYGHQTAAAVRLFQRDHNLKETGKLTLDQFEVLIGECEINLIMPAPSDVLNSQPDVPENHPLEHRLRVVNQSLLIKSALSLGAVLLIAFTVTIAVKDSYSIRVGILNFIEFVFSAPVNRRSSKASEEQSLAVPDSIFVSGKQLKDSHVFNDNNQQALLK